MLAGMAYSLVPYEFPVLRGLGVTLREPSRIDRDSWFERATDPAVYQMTSDDPPAQKADMSRIFAICRRDFERKERIFWMIVPDGETESAGTISFNALSEHDRRGEIGYSLGREWWGQGYARRATEAVLEFGFNELELRRIEATVMSGNLRSRRLLERVGFKEEGLLRQYKLARGVPMDFWIFGLLRGEWAGRS